MPGYTAHRFEPVAYHDLAGRPAFKLALQVVGGRWYLYATRFWEPGIWIVDVTDPSRPHVVGEVPGPPDPNVATWQVQVADGLLVMGMEHRSPRWGGDPSAATDEGLRLFDVSAPAEPRLVGRWRTGASGCHRNHYDGGRFLHVAASAPGHAGNGYVVLDVADPASPVELSRWFLPQQAAGGAVADGGRRVSLHGPAYPDGDRAYLPYGAAGMIVLDISDVAAPAEVSRLEHGPAFGSRIGMHTVLPVPDRPLAVVNTEAIAELAAEPYPVAGVVDLADETAPRLISLFPHPVPAAGAPYPNFNQRGGRFGPHNQHHHQNDPHLFRSSTLVYLTWFNAGLRVYDISDPYLPREVGWFLPADPVVRRGLLPRSALVTQSEDVLVDARGYAYLTDKNHGLHVVRFMGE